MPRLPRIYLQGALYYVTCRGEHEHKLFKEKKDYEMYLELLKKYKQEYGFKLFAYGLLPNQIRLLIQPENEATISEIMHVLNSSYSKYYNSTYQRKGHLFRERFKACLVEKDTYLTKITAYIHLNPKKLGFVKSPGEYPYSSYQLYISTQKQGLDDEVYEVLGYLKGEDYASFTNRLGNQAYSELYRRLRRGMVGSKEFMQQMKELIKQKEKEAQKQANPKVKMTLWVASIGMGIIVVGMVAGVTYYYIAVRTNKLVPPTPTPLANIVQTPQGPIDLNSTEWQVRVVPKSGEAYTDTLTFVNGKIISAHFSKEGFRATNYSETKKDDKVIWETIQTYNETSVSWRGEAEGRKMQGILSLRTPEETQDFSFISIGYRRKE